MGGLLTEHERNMYRPMFLCSLDKLARGLIYNPVCSDEVYKMIGINAFRGGGKEVTDNFVQDAVLNGYVKPGMKREIISTAKGLQRCKENCA